MNPRLDSPAKRRPGPPLLPRSNRAFTLVEVLVSLAVLAVLLTIIAQALGQVQSVWSSANARVAQFREARRAMDRISSNLSQATLNTYMQFYYTASSPFMPASKTMTSGPSTYVRYSELQFLCGPSSSLVQGGGGQTPGHAVFFQAPLGGNVTATGSTVAGSAYLTLPTALSACGYYLKFDDDRGFRPPFLNQRNHPERRRFRLMEYRPPIEANVIYWDPANPSATPGVPNPEWYQQTTQWERPVAENIIFLVFSPKRAVVDASGNPRDIAPNYAYNSSANGVNPGMGGQQAPTDFQLPPLVEVTLVALDENSARNFAESSGGTPSLPTSLFSNANEENFRRDIAQIEDFLNERKLNYRIFTATVPIRNSKWGL